jgi:hypothetical protein
MIAPTSTANPQAAQYMRQVEDELRLRKPRPTHSQVIAAVCKVCGVTESELYEHADDHNRRAKLVATVCLRDICDNATFPSVARWLGYAPKSHSSTVTRYHQGRRDAETLLAIAGVHNMLGVERKDG